MNLPLYMKLIANYSINTKKKKNCYNDHWKADICRNISINFLSKKHFWLSILVYVGVYSFRFRWQCAFNKHWMFESVFPTRLIEWPFIFIINECNRYDLIFSVSHVTSSRYDSGLSCRNAQNHCCLLSDRFISAPNLNKIGNNILYK